MSIEYVNSYNINTPEELIEIFKEGKGVIINGRIYTTLESILEVDYLNNRYDFVTEQLCEDEDDSDNEVKTLEFERIGKLAFDYQFNQDRQAVVENEFESMMGL